MRVRFLVSASALLVAACRPDGPTAVNANPSFSLAGSSNANVLPWTGVFDRQRGEPVTELVEITALNDRAVQEIAVRVVNGDGTGARRVSSAAILINGIEVVKPSDFPMLTDSTILVRIGETRPVVLSTRITGAPGSRLSVGIEAGAPVSPSGGALVLDGGAVAVDVPAGAVNTPIAISAEPLVVAPESNTLAAFEFGPDGSTFEKPLTIRVPLPEAAVVPAGATPGLFFRNTDSDPWEPLDAADYDEATRTVSGEIDHFTQIGVRFREVRVCPNDPTAVSTIDAAVALVSERGAVLLCDADHVVTNLTVSKPLTVGSVAGAPNRPRVRGRFVIEDIGSQQFLVQDIAIDNFVVQGNYRVIEFRRTTFGLAAPSIALYMGLISNPASRVLISESDFPRGNVGIFAPGGSGYFEVTNSTFGSFGFAPIQIQDGTTLPLGGLVQNNEFTNCGTFGCVRTAGGAARSVSLIGNRMRIGVTRGNAVQLSAENLLIENNSIIGNEITGDSTQVASYSISQAAIYINGNNRFAVNAIVNGNSVTLAARGIFADRSTVSWLPITVTGSNNMVNRTVTAVQARGGAIMQLTRNDFLRSALSGALENTLLARPPMSSNGSTLACNWWGLPTGPSGLNNSQLPLAPALFVPAAQQPIAGNAAVACAAP